MIRCKLLGHKFEAVLSSYDKSASECCCGAPSCNGSSAGGSPIGSISQHAMFSASLNPTGVTAPIYYSLNERRTVIEQIYCTRCGVFKKV